MSADRTLGWTGAAAAATQTSTQQGSWEGVRRVQEQTSPLSQKAQEHREFASVAAPVLAELLFSQGSRSVRSLRVVSETGSHLARCAWGTEGFLARVLFDQSHRCVSCASWKDQR